MSKTREVIMVDRKWDSQSKSYVERFRSRQLVATKAGRWWKVFDYTFDANGVETRASRIDGSYCKQLEFVD